ncbi:MAG TPA: hypothetical protein VES73_03955 [Lamprocystis sp. (in: g-proteobacteria)]|nr:hypothetical protein [Lamprocystis sp. (in: g-proteobacteria)]
MDYGWDHAPGATRELIKEVERKAAGLPKGIAAGLEQDLAAFPRSKPPAGSVTMAPGTAVAHARTVRNAFAALPPAARDLVQREGYRIVALPRLSAGMAHLQRAAPAWPGTSWPVSRRLIGIF